MSRADLLRVVSQRLGVEVKPHHLVHAQKCGIVKEMRRAGGWRFYSEENVEQLVRYVQNHSRLAFELGAK